MRKLIVSERTRRGVTVIEATVALVVVAAAAAVGTKTLLSAASHRRHIAERGAAAMEVANAMERVAGGKIEPLETARSEALPLSPEATRILPQGAMTLTIAPAVRNEGGAVLSQRVTVELVWKNGAGQRAAPARLSAWRHEPSSSGAAP